MSACGIRYVAFVQTAWRRVDSGRHRHLIIVLQHSPVSVWENINYIVQDSYVKNRVNPPQIATEIIFLPKVS